MNRTSTLLIAALVPAATAVAQQLEFNRDIRPILADKCFRCHGPDKSHRKAKLRLDVLKSAYGERKGKVAIRPGRPEASELVARISSSDPEYRMPPPQSHKELTADEITKLRRWVAEGAEYEAHWSFVAPKRRELPAVKNDAWPRGFVDRWILARLEREGITKAPEADKVTLLRRLSFDLSGLPPSPEEVAAFLADNRLDAYERAVDRLLASPRYGERMAVYWLDLVRYADTVGYHGDQEHPIAPYRDWVIDAFNMNMGFDQFTIEQLAGDLLPNSTEQQKIASGYNRLLQTTHEGGAQAKEYLAIYAADRVRNFGSVWLGATIGCAQCHDHKYDPYTAKDFYSLAAFFADIEEKGDFKGSPDRSPTTRPPELVILNDTDRKQIRVVEASLKKLRGPQHKAERQTLQKQRKAIRARGRRTMITVATKPRVVRVLPRGNWLDDSGEVVQPAVPHFLPQIRVADGRRANRLDLARWLTRKDQPQTARVFVNRLWCLFFGKGLSARLEDFGVQGEWPEHPELLDALAIEFVDSGRDIKHMVRLLVTSSAYRQASAVGLSEARPSEEGSSEEGLSDAMHKRDPHNRLVARQSHWRLPAEMIRDNALAISGLLVQRIGGESVRPYQPAGYYRHLNFPKRRYRQHSDERQWRRGVYMHWQRMFLHPALLAFDAPTREECTPERPVSNTPQAALTLLNDPTFVEAARAFAARLLREAKGDRGRLARGFLLATSRQPNAQETAVLRRVLAKHRVQYRADPVAAARLLQIGLSPVPKEVDPVELAAWTSVARVLLNLNETTTRN